MRVFYFFALILQFIPIRGYSQLTANTAMSPTQLVQNVLLGTGVTATNITYTGVTGSRGTYTCSGICNLGISNGIVLSTGYIDGSGGANIGGNATNFISDNLLLPGDPDLDQIANDFTYDAVSLEFDFSVASDSVSFRYVFASEEYNEFVASSYNDVFGFFISGPCFPPGGTNIALIPGTSTPVSINNVNNGYSTGSASGPCNNCSYYVDNYTGNSVAFDGFTTVLTASAKVVPCATYRIKIVIADVGDGIYDSAVFLEANSFSSIGTVPIIVNNVTHYSDSSLTICPGQNVQICAATPCTSGASVLQWNNGSSSLCQTPVPGDYNYTFTNTVNVCTANSPVITVTQPANSSIDIAQDTIIDCTGSPVTITATGSANLIWNTGASSQSITVNSPGWYSVSATGACGPVSDSVFVQLNNVTASISGATNVCAGVPVILTSYPTGMQYLWSDGQTTQNITVNQTGNYTVTVTTPDGCTSTASVSLNQINPPSPVIQGDSTICSGLTTSLDAGNPVYTNYVWSNNDTTPQINVSVPGNYTVTVTDTNGCAATASVTVSLNQLPSPSITGNTSLCDGDTTTLDAGSGFVNYVWSDSSTLQTISVNAGGNYSVIVTDANGCTGTDNITVSSNNSPVPVISGLNSICDGNSTTLDAGTGYASYLWSDNSTSQTISVSSGGIYLVTVTDSNGCSGTASETVTVNQVPIPIISGITSICDGETTTLDAGSGFTNYLWSNSSSSQTININTAGNYTVIVTDTNGCTATAIETIIVNTIPTPSISGNLAICDGETSTLDAGSGFVDYAWSDSSTSQAILVNAAGNYSVIVTDANGCTGTDNVTVSSNNSPVPVISGLNSVCDGNSTILDAGPGYSSYLWSDNSTSQTISVSSGGIYFVTVTDSNGCSGTASENIIINSLPVPLISGPSSFCVGSFTNLDAGSGFSNYLWSTGETTQNITVSSAGIITVTVTDSSGCSGSDSITISEQLNLMPVITGNNLICPGDNSILDAGPGYNSYLWSDSSTNQTLIVSGTGNYMVTVSDATGCTGTAVFNLTVLTPPSTIVTGNNSICIGESTVFDAGANFTGYLWSDNSTMQTINVNSAGIYSVTVTDANGCTGTASITLTINNLPAPSITGINTICDGDVTTFDAGQGYASYLWSDNSTAQTITANSAGIYSVTVTDPNGCSDSTSHTLMVNPLPQPVISGSTSFCPSGFTVLDAGSGFASYNWSTGESTQSINMNTLGLCSVTVTDNNGCVASTGVNITLEPNLTPVITGNTNICLGEITILDAGNSFATYQWSTGSTSQSITVDSSGVYSVSVTDVSGCDGTASVNVVVNTPALPVISGSTAFCTGGFTILNAGSGFGYYLWSTGDTSQSVTINNAGIIGVTVTDNNGCMSTANVNVQVLANLTPEISGNVNICQGETTILDAGAGYNTYLWSNGSTGQTINVNSAGNYQVTVTDASGCSGTDAININLNNNPVPVITGNTEFCDGNSSILSAGNNYISYLWSNNENQSNINVNSSGNYSVTVTDANGCTGSASVNITVNPLPLPFINGDTLICFGENTTLDAGSGFINYQWSNNQTTQTINVNTSGNYSVTVTDQNGCNASTQINLNVSIPEAEITADGPTTFCDGEDVTLTANPGTSYLWSTGDFTQQITINIPGIYIVTVVDNVGCDTISNPVEITVNENPVVDFSADPLVGCAPLNVNFNNHSTNAVNYHWNFGDSTNSNLLNPEHVFVEPGYYSVALLAVSSEGCEAELTYNDLIFAADKPNVDFSYSPDELLMFASTCSFYDNSEDAVTWHWQFGDGKVSALKNPQHYYNKPGSYHVKLIVANQYGCVNEKETQLVVTPFYLPNSFTPNNDGTNETFYPFGFEMDVTEFHLAIFDRWGNLIFESDHPHNTWNGNYHNGELVPEGVYVYSYTITTPDKKVHKYNGRLNLIR